MHTTTTRSANKAGAEDESLTLTLTLNLNHTDNVRRPSIKKAKIETNTKTYINTFDKVETDT